MCSINWCEGDCDSCKAEAEYMAQFEENMKECPYRKECNWVTVDVKNDRCTTCDQTFNYP